MEQCNMPSTVLRDKCNVQHVHDCQICLCLFELGQRSMLVSNTSCSLEKMYVFQGYSAVYVNQCVNGKDFQIA